jgi:uncharacterized protein (DUF2062 family)
MKYLAKLKDYVVRFSSKGLSTNEIAFGIALGNFVGFIPVMGTHTIVAIGLAYLLRLNTLIVLLGTQISNPLSYPFQLFITAEVGNLILNGRFLEIKFSKEISYYLDHLVWPILVGSPVLGVIISGLSFFLVRSFLRKRKAPAAG